MRLAHLAFDKEPPFPRHPFLQREGHELEERIDRVLALGEAGDAPPPQERDPAVQHHVQQAGRPVAHGAHRLAGPPEGRDQLLDRRVGGVVEHRTMAAGQEDPVKAIVTHPRDGQRRIQPFERIAHVANLFFLGIATRVHRGRPSPWADHRDGGAGFDEQSVGLRELAEPDAGGRDAVDVTVTGDEHQNVWLVAHRSIQSPFVSFR
jgi:hypothetical protein